MASQIKLWDLPTRVFHWSLVLAVAAAFISGQLGGNLIDVHGKLGLFILGLLVFRLVWGFTGSTYARFLNFVPTPNKIGAYLKGEWQGLGHNPLGALSVFALLGVLLLQVGMGLFANDDIAFVGPLYSLISKELSDKLTGLHHLVGKVILLLVCVHVAAIAFYARVKKHNLVLPMLTGKVDVPDSEKNKAAVGGGLLALLFALACAAAVVYVASGQCLPTPITPPASNTATPAW